MEATDLTTQKAIIAEVINELKTQIANINLELDNGGYEIIRSELNRGNVFIRKPAELTHKEFLEAYLVHYESIFQSLCQLENYRQLGTLSELKVRLNVGNETSAELKNLKAKLNKIAKLSCN